MVYMKWQFFNSFFNNMKNYQKGIQLYLYVYLCPCTHEAPTTCHDVSRPLPGQLSPVFSRWSMPRQENWRGNGCLPKLKWVLVNIC